MAFSLTPPSAPGGRWTEEVLHTFAGDEGDGAGPSGGLAIGKGGALYGVTDSGGAAAAGTVFSLRPPASQGPWTETVLYEFTGGIGGSAPTGVAIGSGGILYGTTSGGGSSNNGTAFSLAPPATKGGAWTQATLYNFAGSPSDGANPFGAPAVGKSGALYGTTLYGGTMHPYCGFAGCGVAYQLTPPASSGGAWIETLLHDFTSGSDGEYPLGVAISKSGVLYGATSGSGAPSGGGTIYSMKP